MRLPLLINPQICLQLMDLKYISEKLPLISFGVSAAYMLVEPLFFILRCLDMIYVLIYIVTLAKQILFT